MIGADLRLAVEHLGPVEHGEVKLRPLTIFVGRNNTGKTYVAQALYACRQAVHAVRPRRVEDLNDDQRADLEALARGRYEIPANGGMAEEEPLYRLGSKALQDGLEDAGRIVQQRMKATFGVSELADIGSWGSQDGLRLELMGTDLQGDRVCLFGSGGTTVPVDKMTRQLHIAWPDLDHVLPEPTLFERSADTKELEYLYEHLGYLVAGGYWNRFLDQLGLGGETHYLPAGRSGLLDAWTDVVKLRMQLEKERLGLPSFSGPSLDGVALDFISSIADVLGDRPRWRSRFFDPVLTHQPPERDALKSVLEMLRVLMEGTISRDSERELVPTLAYEQDGHQIAIRHASSMVSDLAPLAIWVERLLTPGDTLIVDEPESHLYPGAVRLVARVLIRLANCGVQVVCATHSSVLLNEVSNCLLRQKTATLETDELTPAYTSDDLLVANDLAVHRFVRGGTDKSVTVEEVEVDPDWGIPEDEFVKVAEDLSEESARLVGLLD